MIKLIKDCMILFIIPLIISEFININLILVFIYIGLVLCIITPILKKSSEEKKGDEIKNWPYLVSNKSVFYICCFFLLINYYSSNLPELFPGADKFYHIIFCDPIKGIVYSIIAAIAFTWYVEYRQYSRNYYLYCYLKSHIRKLWTLLYNVEYIKYFIYLDLTEKKINKLIFEEKKDKKAGDLLRELDILELKKCIEEIEKILFSMDTPVNQSIYYLLQNVNTIIYKYESNKINNTDYKLENLTISISKRTKNILIELNNFEKKPLEAIMR